jgi:hypothetical protein
LVPVIGTLVPPAIGPADGLTPVMVGGATNVNWSAVPVALVPPGVVTVISMVPADCAGAVAVILLELLMVKVLAAVPPKLTAVAPVNPVPLIVTLVPPAVGPEAGLTLVTEGTYLKTSLEFVALVPPPGIVTVTSTAPVPAGEVAVIDVALLTVKLLAAVPPKLTAVAPVKVVPAIVTDVPPAAGPEEGLTRVTVGGVTYVYWSLVLVALVPPGVVTVMSMVPAAPAGAVAEIWLELFTKNVAAVPPKLTPVAPVKPVPLIVTVVPPVVGPDVGLTLVTDGTYL